MVQVQRLMSGMMCNVILDQSIGSIVYEDFGEILS
jgi:hypothetical protein